MNENTEYTIKDTRGSRLLDTSWGDTIFPQAHSVRFHVGLETRRVRYERYIHGTHGSIGYHERCEGACRVRFVVEGRFRSEWVRSLLLFLTGTIPPYERRGDDSERGVTVRRRYWFWLRVCLTKQGEVVRGGCEGVPGISIELKQLSDSCCTSFKTKRLPEGRSTSKGGVDLDGVQRWWVAAYRGGRRQDLEENKGTSVLQIRTHGRNLGSAAEKGRVVRVSKWMLEW